MQKYLRIAGIAFLIFYLLSNPDGAAKQVNNVIGGLEGAGNSLATFVNKVG